MATLNFINFINTNWQVDGTIKQKMLDDFCSGWSESNGVSKIEFANNKIEGFIVSTILDKRRGDAINAIKIEEFKFN